ncbi:MULTISPECIES: cell envelope integrity protein TolA [unclassified Rubrivivax]|uniref:cell envelope integrity protein TolA n=1 Tax=unclassified Rubrivivax TaxID=2649762 RepID=UPI0013E95FE7|nr:MULTISPECIES: cell envelope integrity protein TolA [unclassified Rubrivivax]MCC9595354.1 cell envelope integrity protein TolA [Rubrivivax sp. JA1055]MCC9647139.1 cell envelope integrity protein TolA [Rubrivivax sp. JA1029]
MAHDALQPRPPDSLVPGAGLALLVHGLLIVGLTVAVDWHSAEPETISAELWAAVPEVAAPPPAPEPPPPAPEPRPAPEPKPAPPQAAPERDAEIATERAERRKKEEEREKRELAEKQAAEKKAREKAEAEKKAKAEADEKKKAEQQKLAAQKAEAQRLAKLREDQLKRLQNSLGGTGTGAATSTGTAARDAGPSASYGGKLRRLIKDNTVFTESVSGNPQAEVEVRAGPTGTIIARRLIKSSGLPSWDEAVLRAIDRIGTLPRDVDGRVPPVIVVTARPND